MKQNYRPFIDRMIQRYEGGYCWDKGDPGGPTKYGITCYDLAEHRGEKMTSMVEWAPIVKDMTLAEAEEIYASKYARAIRFDDLPSGVDCVMMDYAVNSGIDRAILVARRLCGIGDGPVMSAALVDAINSKSPKWFVDTMDAERLAFMHKIRGGTAWDQFGGGWGARVSDLTTYAEHLAAGNPIAQAPTAPDLSKVPTPKATHVDDPHANNKALGGTVAAGTATATAAHQAGLPVWAIAAFLGAALVAGAIYFIWKSGQAARLNNQVHLAA